MDQKTLLAIVLSLLVLFGYNVLTQKPRAAAPANFTQTLDNNVDMKVPTAKSAVAEPGSSTSPSPAVSPVIEKIQTLESPDLSLEFSNQGGSLKKITVKKFHYTLPVNRVLSLGGYEDTEFVLKSVGENHIEYSLDKDGLHIVKQYRFSSEGHALESDIEITGLDNMSNEKKIHIVSLMLDMSNLDVAHLAREGSLFEYSVSRETGPIFRKGNATKFVAKEDRIDPGVVNWIGFRDRYFCILVKPLFHTEGSEIKQIAENKLKIALNAPKTAKYSFLIYAGPQDLSLLKKQKAGFEDIISFSNFGLFDVAAKGIYQLISWLHKIIPSWGTCIVLVSLIIYGSLYPLTIAGMMSMKRMQALQPRITKLREQHKNNPQKLNTEIMELYKTNKVNPFGGCLPFLLQMPIFIGLYQVLWRSVFFKGSSFLWIKDLAEPDRLFIFPFTMPFLGNEFNILPILMAIVMFFQQKISAKNMVVTDPDQVMQQKMMLIFMPIFLGFVFYKFASGLSLYFTTFYLLSTLTQLKMSKVTVAA